ncbi:MAG: TonB-dependent receptor plug domain-containing protein [Phocaeicola sp.]
MQLFSRKQASTRGYFLKPLYTPIYTMLHPFTKIICHFLLLTLLAAPIAAQSRLNKTQELEEVTVTAQKQKKEEAVGARMTQVERTSLVRNLTKSLSELLTESSSLYIKSMGQGALATASFRGTASSHTQVLWNGISINSAQIGSFDFSQVPIYFVDQASLTHGTAAQEDGSGALGGSINFSNQFMGDKPFSGSILTEAASNDTYTGAATIRSTVGKVQLTTRGYYQQSDNDYRYLNKVYSKDPFYERRSEADYKQAGAMQELYYKTQKGDRLKAIAWWQYDNRSLPQSTIVYATASEQTRTENLRTLVSYDLSRNLHSLSLTAAYLREDRGYEKVMGDYGNENSQSLSNSFVAKAAYRFNHFKRVPLQALLTYRHDNVYSDNYEGGKQSRNTTSLKLMATWKVLPQLHFDAQTTTQLADSDLSAIYNLSARYHIIPEYLTLKASNGYNYRLPTLNDLYWNPGGNPDLAPEKGFSSDISLVSNPTWGRTTLLLEATYYHMDIENWIMWIPKGSGAIWEPVNFDKVRSRGIELNAQITTHWGATKHQLGGNYGLALSTNNSRHSDKTQGRQLPYIPRHKWNISYRMEYKDKFWFSYLLSFTDKRFTTADESYQTNAFTVHNAEAGYNLSLPKGKKMSFSLRGDNLFDAYYESTQYYPMPLRMLWGRVMFDF